MEKSAGELAQVRIVSAVIGRRAAVANRQSRNRYRAQMTVSAHGAAQTRTHTVMLRCAAASPAGVAASRQTPACCRAMRAE